MLALIWESQFKRDLKRAKKSRLDFSKLEHIVSELRYGVSLPVKYRNHKLKGNYSDCWECHIEPDWLLIYKLTSTELILVRTGSHSELF